MNIYIKWPLKFSGGKTAFYWCGTFDYEVDWYKYGIFWFAFWEQENMEWNNNVSLNCSTLWTSIVAESLRERKPNFVVIEKLTFKAFWDVNKAGDFLLLHSVICHFVQEPLTDVGLSFHCSN